MKSTFLSLGASDFFKGLIMAVGTPVLYLLQQLIPSWTPVLTAHLGATGGVVAQAALSALITYLTKNLFTDSVSEAQTTLITQAKKTGDTTVTVTPTSITTS
jgi:hypothetical protein